MKQRQSLAEKKSRLFRLQVSEEILMDAQQLVIGGYAPLKGFMLKEDLECVLDKMRLASGEVWPLPITLDVNEKQAAAIKTGQELMLVDGQGRPIAILIAEQIYAHNKSRRCRMTFGTEDTAHPGVAKVMAMGEILIGGRITDFLDSPSFALDKFMMGPDQTKAYFKRKGWKSITGFHTRNVVHRAHEYLQRLALEYTDGLLIHPVAGSTKAGDFKKEFIIKGYQRLIENYYPKDRVLLAALGISMKFAGPRAAVFHALVRRNYGCTHIIIGRDHAGVGGYYDNYAAHKIFAKLPHLGITPLLFKGPFYCKKCKGIATENTCAHQESDRLAVSGTLVRKLIREKQRPPEWLMRPEIADLFDGLADQAFIQ